ncbi:MAG TPA: class I SAM-dependent methyltransferase [Gemmatimonadaceae bacterium]
MPDKTVVAGVRGTVQAQAGGPRENVDPATVEHFGREWSYFDQTGADAAELASTFQQYFSIFPWGSLPARAVGFDFGCGSGRWAAFVAPRVGDLHCVDASETALEVARRNLASVANCHFHLATPDTLPFADSSMDFAYSLGVLHHLPDPARGLEACVRKLKPGAPFLVYLYYRFDDRPAWFRAVWRGSDVARRLISRLPHRARLIISGGIAALVYWPLARAAAWLDGRGADISALPLSFYRHRSFYTMRNDALDRFGTRLEHRYTAGEIESMMRSAGLTDIQFSTAEPYWCAVGRRRSDGVPGVAG